MKKTKSGDTNMTCTNNTIFDNFKQLFPASYGEAVDKTKDAAIKSVEFNFYVSEQLFDAFEEITGKKFTTYTDMGRKSLKESTKVAKETIDTFAKVASGFATNGNTK